VHHGDRRLLVDLEADLGGLDFASRRIADWID
jgi:hypothetical protein